MGFNSGFKGLRSFQLIVRGTFHVSSVVVSLSCSERTTRNAGSYIPWRNCCWRRYSYGIGNFCLCFRDPSFYDFCNLQSVRVGIVCKRGKIIPSVLIEIYGVKKDLMLVEYSRYDVD